MNSMDILITSHTLQRGTKGFRGSDYPASRATTDAFSQIADKNAVKEEPLKGHSQEPIGVDLLGSGRRTVNGHDTSAIHANGSSPVTNNVYATDHGMGLRKHNRLSGYANALVNVRDSRYVSFKG